MSGIYNCTLFVHLYICIDYSGGSGCCVRACEVGGTLVLWYLECCVRGVVFLFFSFRCLFLVLVLVEEKERKRKKREEEDTLTIDGL